MCRHWGYVGLGFRISGLKFRVQHVWLGLGPRACLGLIHKVTRSCSPPASSDPSARGVLHGTSVVFVVVGSLCFTALCGGLFLITSATIIRYFCVALWSL